MKHNRIAIQIFFLKFFCLLSKRSMMKRAKLIFQRPKIKDQRPKITLTLPAMNSPTPYGYVMMPTSAVVRAVRRIGLE